MHSFQWQNKLTADPLPWLLNSNPWTKYRTLLDLLNQPLSSDDVVQAENDLSNHHQIQSLISETADWFPQSITRHNDAKICYYKLQMLVDFGLTVKNKGIKELIPKIIEHTDNSFYAVRQVLPEKGYPKPDLSADEWHALPCDSPIISYALFKMGYQHEQLNQSIENLKNYWETPQGFFCNFFFVSSHFKKHNIGCPMAGLMALQVFSQVPELKESVSAQNAFEAIDYHRRLGKSIYYFGRGKKFFTLKYPFVWYNALYLADVLSRFEFTKETALMKELIDWILSSQNEDGTFTPTSIWMAYKEWEFSNKKQPSPWITFLCCRILKNYFNGEQQ